MPRLHCLLAALLLAAGCVAARPLSPEPENQGALCRAHWRCCYGFHHCRCHLCSCLSRHRRCWRVRRHWRDRRRTAHPLLAARWHLQRRRHGIQRGCARHRRRLCLLLPLPQPLLLHPLCAINKPMWDDGAACGRCITAWCVDDRCPVQGKKVTVMVTDLCPECKEGDVDFSIPVYREITGMWPHRLRVQWEWADCSPMVDGNILLTPKTVRLNGMDLQRSEFQFWVHPAPLSSPATFEFEAVNGARVSTTVDDPLKNQTLPVNFQ
ncbi:hypothetical protein ABPG77_004430 [Micractinium sp. CCAP 211/92]